MFTEEQPLAYSFGRLARLFGTSRDTWIRAANRGEVKTIPIAGRRLVPRAEVERIRLEGFGGRKNGRAVKSAQAVAQ